MWAFLVRKPPASAGDTDLMRKIPEKELMRKIPPSERMDEGRSSCRRKFGNPVHVVRKESDMT